MAALPLSFLDALIKGAVVLSGAAVLARLLRGQSAAARHAVWTAALLAQLALPVLAIALPSWDLPILPRRAAPISAPALAPGAPQLTSVSRNSPAGAASTGSRIPLRLPSTSTVLLVVWLAGFAAVLTRLGLGTATVARLARRAERVDDGEWLSLAQRTAGTLGIRRPITLLSGGQLQIPVTWGTMYPTVLLPYSATDWSDERRRLVLTHELAHVQRFDALTQLVGQIALALFWMNPLVWLAVHRMSVERECACDDYVLRGGTVASTYAQELLEIVRSLTTARGPAFAALAIAGRSDFESRLLAILSPTVQRRAMARGGAMAIACAAALVVLPLASIRPVARPEASPRRAIAAAPRRASSPVRQIAPAAMGGAMAAAKPARVTSERRAGSARNRRVATVLAVDPSGQHYTVSTSSIQVCDQMVRIASDGRTARIAITKGPRETMQLERCEVSVDLSSNSVKRHAEPAGMVAMVLNSARGPDTCHTTKPSDGQDLAGREQKVALGQPMPATIRLPLELVSGSGTSQQLAARHDGKLVASVKLDPKTDSLLLAMLPMIEVLRLYDTLQRMSPAAGNRPRTSAS